MTGRPEAIAVVSTIAVFLAGVGVGAILNGIAHAAEIAGLHATIRRLRDAADGVRAPERRPLSPHHLRDARSSREAQSHAASLERRGPTT